MRARLAGVGLALMLAPLAARAAGPLTQAAWGEPVWQGSTADLGRGGAGMGLMDSTRIGGHNPALFHSGRLTRFQLEFSGTRSRVSTPEAGESFSSGQFSAAAVAFPLLWQDLHAGLSLVPLTHMDYFVAERGRDSQDREFVNSLKGVGGLSRVGLTLSRSLTGELRAGADLGLVFGSVLEEWKLFYPEAAPPYDSWVERRRSLLGFQGRLGLHWQPRPGLGLGLACTLPGRADHTVDLENKSNDVDEEIATARVDLPGELALGLAWRRAGLDWLLDLRLQDWSATPLGASAAEDGGRRERPLAVAAGVDLPLLRDFSAPWYRRVSWRAGLRREEWYSGRARGDGSWQDLSTTAVSLGAGVPLKAFGSWLDLALEAGRTGEESLQEDFVRLRLGFGARDLWFVRPVY